MINFQLSGSNVTNLWRVHAKVTIEGILFDEILEAEPFMTWSIVWNGFDVYEQKVIGQTVAHIEIGYQILGKCSCKVMKSTLLCGNHDHLLSRKIPQKCEMIFFHLLSGHKRKKIQFSNFLA